MLLASGRPRQADDFLQVPLQDAEASGSEITWSEIRLQVELSDLSGESRVIRAREDLGGYGRGPELGIHEKHLLLGTDARRSVIHQAVIEHVLERCKVVEQGLLEARDQRLVSGRYLVYSHR